MADGLNIRKISSPIIGASRVDQAKKHNPDSNGKQFQRHLKDEKDEGSNEGSSAHTEPLDRKAKPDNKGHGSEEKMTPEPINGNLGKKIDILV